jgi:hypothetical protein
MRESNRQPAGWVPDRAFTFERSRRARLRDGADGTRLPLTALATGKAAGEVRAAQLQNGI